MRFVLHDDLNLTSIATSHYGSLRMLGSTPYPENSSISASVDPSPTPHWWTRFERLIFEPTRINGSFQVI